MSAAMEFLGGVLFVSEMLCLLTTPKFVSKQGFGDFGQAEKFKTCSGSEFQDSNTPAGTVGAGGHTKIVAGFVGGVLDGLGVELAKAIAGSPGGLLVGLVEHDKVAAGCTSSSFSGVRGTIPLQNIFLSKNTLP